MVRLLRTLANILEMNLRVTQVCSPYTMFTIPCRDRFRTRGQPYKLPCASNCPCQGPLLGQRGGVLVQPWPQTHVGQWIDVRGAP